ncbi:MAG: hypothetical protein KDD82_18225 [Planctomycetes bacterium]|nr:hypothetical protein [Planctomycetota bacterium]
MAKKKTSKKKTSAKKTAAKKKASTRKKTAAKKKTSTRKKTAAKKKTSTRKKTAARKKTSARKKTAAKLAASEAPPAKKKKKKKKKAASGKRGSVPWSERFRDRPGPWTCPKCGSLPSRLQPLYGEDEKHHCPMIDCDAIVALPKEEIEPAERRTGSWPPQRNKGNAVGS